MVRALWACYRIVTPLGSVAGDWCERTHCASSHTYLRLSLRITSLNKFNLLCTIDLGDVSLAIDTELIHTRVLVRRVPVTLLKLDLHAVHPSPDALLHQTLLSDVNHGISTTNAVPHLDFERLFNPMGRLLIESVRILPQREFTPLHTHALANMSVSTKGAQKTSQGSARARCSTQGWVERYRHRENFGGGSVLALQLTVVLQG